MEVPHVKIIINKDADSTMLLHRMDDGFFFRNKNLLKEISGLSTEEAKRKISEFIDRFYAENANLLESRREDIQSAWDIVNDKVMLRLSKMMQTSWYDTDITGVLSLNPICPRNLKESSFFISYFYDTKKTNGIILHEITHFLFFKKWKEVFKDYDEKEFDTPHLIWNLSEIVVEPIDEDSELQTVVPERATAYKKYHKIIVPGRDIDLVEYFRRLYSENASSGGDFAQFLVRAKNEINKLSSLFS
jgi:hypothetical protein